MKAGEISLFVWFSWVTLKWLQNAVHEGAVKGTIRRVVICVVEGDEGKVCEKYTIFKDEK